jgi:2-polyprenyl-3-methyl-5-hydroxy-6-metoxy-1,4-benzoquinol methylase
MIYMNRSASADIRYTEIYFFENYKKQYGKTYLEDFPNLTAMAERRLKIIKSLLGEGGHSLLDIGCAYGAFAAAAREKGFDCIGIDGSAAAAAYVRDELGISAFDGFFPEEDLIKKVRESVRREFDAVTLWYVIEHFEIDAGAYESGSMLKTALEQIHALLRAGGVLAFSTPNSSGVSGRFSLKKFLEKSPPDHWTIWDCRHAGKILSRFGFTVQKIVVTGHHPERFPFCSGLKPGSFAYKALLALSKLLRLGDTFEVYAKKSER